MRAARLVVEHAAHGTSEHTYGVNTGFGRFVSKSIPEELTKELQLRLLRSHACGVGEPYPDEVVRAAMLLRANTLAKGLLRRAHRDHRAAARLPEPAGASARPQPRLGRRERRPCAARAPGAPARRRRRGAGRRQEHERRRRACRGRARARRARGEGGPVAHQRNAVHGRVRSARARPRASSREGCGHRVRALARSPAGLANELHPRDPRASPAAGAASLGRERRPPPRRLGDQRVTSLVRQGSGRVFAALRSAGARCRSRPPRLRRTDRRRRAECGDRQPARPRRRGAARVERQLSRTAARVRPRRIDDGGRRAREHLGTPNRTARQSVAIRWVAGVPDAGRRSQQRLHAAAVRRGRRSSARTRFSHIRRASTRSRRAPATRITFRWGTRRRSKAWQALANSEWTLAIELLAGAQARGVPRAARARPRRGGRARRSCAVCRHGSRKTARSPATSTPSPRRFAAASSSRPSKPKSASSHETPSLGRRPTAGVRCRSIRIAIRRSSTASSRCSSS